MECDFYTTDGIFIFNDINMPIDFTGYVVYVEKGSPHMNTKTWCLKGQRHRIGGPAVEYIQGYQYWYVYNKQITKEQHDLLFGIMKLKGLL